MIIFIVRQSRNYIAIGTKKVSSHSKSRNSYIVFKGTIYAGRIIQTVQNEVVAETASTPNIGHLFRFRGVYVGRGPLLEISL